MHEKESRPDLYFVSGNRVSFIQNKASTTLLNSSHFIGDVTQRIAHTSDTPSQNG